MLHFMGYFLPSRWYALTVYANGGWDDMMNIDYWRSKQAL